MKLNPTAQEYTPSWQPQPQAGSHNVPSSAPRLPRTRPDGGNNTFTVTSYAAPPYTPSWQNPSLVASAPEFIPTPYRTPSAQPLIYSPPYTEYQPYKPYGQRPEEVYVDPHAPSWSPAPSFQEPFRISPALQMKAQKSSEAPGSATPHNVIHMPTADNPLVLLFLGCRGSGKTTQSLKAAEKYNLLHISSGDICKENKEPFGELKRMVREEFGDGVKRRYAGIVLDRFIARSEADVYYMEDALSVAGLPTPLAIWLRVDLNVGLERAANRKEKKEASALARLEEQRIHSGVMEKVFKPAGSLLVIEGNEKSAEEVFRTVVQHIENTNDGRSSRLSLPTPNPGFSGYIVKNYDVYQKLKSEVHAALGNTSWRIDSAPLSTMASYIDKKAFTPPQMKKLGLESSFVTLKADGERYLLVKHRTKGFFAFPAKFTHLFNVDEHFLDFSISPPANIPLESQLRENATNVEFILDTELCVRENKATFFIIDFLYFYQIQGSRMRFAERYGVLREAMSQYTSSTPPGNAVVVKAPVQVKDYVPIRMLKTLLPSWEDAPFPIDGVVFQHGDTYCCGTDKLLAKWKPRALCTADFRLSNGQHVSPNDWKFQLDVVAFSNGVWIEKHFPGAVSEISQQDVKKHHLSNSVVVELSLQDQTSAGHTSWKFHRCRNDKVGPNKYEIVEKIVSMQHLDYEELLSCVSTIDFRQLPPSHFAALSHK